MYIYKKDHAGTSGWNGVVLSIIVKWLLVLTKITSGPSVEDEILTEVSCSFIENN